MSFGFFRLLVLPRYAEAMFHFENATLTLGLRTVCLEIRCPPFRIAMSRRPVLPGVRPSTGDAGCAVFCIVKGEEAGPVLPLVVLGNRMVEMPVFKNVRNKREPMKCYTRSRIRTCDVCRATLTKFVTGSLRGFCKECLYQLIYI